MNGAEHSAAIEEIDRLIERDLGEALVGALRCEGPFDESPTPHWMELADRFRRGAELADSLAKNAEGGDRRG